MIDNIISILIRFYPQFLQGLGTTLLLSALAVVLGTVLGSLLALGKMSRFAVLRIAVTTYIEIVRGTPLLLQLYIVFFLLPDLITWLDVTTFQSVLTALVLNSAAYVAEIIRAGIQAVDKGQSEAARSLGLSQAQTMRRIIMPQAIKTILPTLCNEFIMVIKETSLASVFFIGDLMTAVNVLRGALFLSIEPLVIAGVIYFLVTFSLSKLVFLYERRLAASD